MPFWCVRRIVPNEPIWGSRRWFEGPGPGSGIVPFMGGRAFLQTLPPGSLPRLPTSLYLSLKARTRALLSTLFAIVDVPPERPEKQDHGDIDFVVARPLDREITPERVSRALGAIQSIELDGNRTSNYAVAIDRQDWLMHSPQPTPSDHIYCQVDVKMCDDEEEVEGMIVFHGYGDLGIVIGAIAKSHGLSVNPSGLKISSPHPDPPIYLTRSPRLIFDFMGLSLDRWREGFETVEETFKFAATSRFFDPRLLHVPSMNTFKKSVQGRSMYTDFLVWAQDKNPTTSVLGRHQGATEEALVVFGKKSEWDAMIHERYSRTWLKSNFNGKLVAEWTGLGWKGVKAVMDDVRASVGGERALVGMELGQVKSLVLMSQKSLKLDA